MIYLCGSIRKSFFDKTNKCGKVVRPAKNPSKSGVDLRRPHQRRFVYWPSLQLFWHRKHSLPPVFTRNGPMDSGNSYSDRFLFQPEKSEKKQGKTCDKFTTDVSVNFANSTVHFSQCGGHDIFLYQLKL